MATYLVHVCIYSPILTYLLRIKFELKLIIMHAEKLFE